MSRHVVFGTGQIGRLVAERLVSLGADVTSVNRSGRGSVNGAQVVAGDAADPMFTARVCAGADAVYFCLNPPRYDNWTRDFPPLQHGVLTAAEAAGARLVVLDNLYAYGSTGGRDLVESLPANPASAKAATRAAMTAELLAAHQVGRVEVAIGRASDFFGPGVTQSALGGSVFGTAVSGRTAQVMGNPDLEHSYSYAPDVAAALVTLGTAASATGRVWHLPVAAARTTRDIVGQVYALAGRRPRILAAGRTTLRLIGIVNPAMREYLHTLYQFSERWVVDDTAFRTAFGALATPLDDALAATTTWYRPQRRRPRTGAHAGRLPPVPAAAHLAGHRHRRDHRIRPDGRVHRSRGSGRHPGERSALDGLPRLCGGGAHRHRRGRSARAGHRAPHELRRLCELVRMAGGHGHRAVARHPDGLGRHSRGSSR
jgi:nucleoside-diphosphate-sugar epimerase